MAQLQGRKDGSDQETFRFCVLLLTPPTKFCRKPEKLNLNLIGLCQIPCFTEVYMHNSIKKSEYVFLDLDLGSFFFLIRYVYPNLSFTSIDFRMQLEQYARQHRTISGSHVNKQIMYWSCWFASGRFI